ncbi:MAG: type II toxin-antitoxin system HicB family antitoxin [Candidatus Micrarchaeia archaeon]
MAQKVNVKVVLHKEKDGGYWVEVPSLPGCVSQGETKRESLANVREAILVHLESLGTYRKSTANSHNRSVATVSLAV